MILGVVTIILALFPLTILISRPLSWIGVALVLIGLILAIARKGAGIGYPITGGALNTAALIIAAFWSAVFATISDVGAGKYRSEVKTFDHGKQVESRLEPVRSTEPVSEPSRPPEIKPAAKPEKKPNNNPQSEEEKQYLADLHQLFPAGIPDVFVSLERLLSDYKDNEIAAEQKYVNKYVEVNGKLKRVARDSGGKAYAEFTGDGLFVNSLKCYFEPQWDLSTLKAKHFFTLQGAFQGKEPFYVVLKDCRFVSEEENAEGLKYRKRSKSNAEQEAQRETDKAVALSREKAKASIEEKRKREEATRSTPAQNADSKLKLAKLYVDQSNAAKTKGDVKEWRRLQDSAKDSCREITKSFPGTTAARDAQKLLDELKD